MSAPHLASVRFIPLHRPKLDGNSCKNSFGPHLLSFSRFKLRRLVFIIWTYFTDISASSTEIHDVICCCCVMYTGWAQKSKPLWL